MYYILAAGGMAYQNYLASWASKFAEILHAGGDFDDVFVEGRVSPLGVGGGKENLGETPVQREGGC